MKCNSKKGGKGMKKAYAKGGLVTKKKEMSKAMKTGGGYGKGVK